MTEYGMFGEATAYDGVRDVTSIANILSGLAGRLLYIFMENKILKTEERIKMEDAHLRLKFENEKLRIQLESENEKLRIQLELENERQRIQLEIEKFKLQAEQYRAEQAKAEAESAKAEAESEKWKWKQKNARDEEKTSEARRKKKEAEDRARDFEDKAFKSSQKAEETYQDINRLKAMIQVADDINEAVENKQIDKIEDIAKALVPVDMDSQYTPIESEYLNFKI